MVTLGEFRRNLDANRQRVVKKNGKKHSLVQKKTCRGSKIDQNLEIDQCMKKLTNRTLYCILCGYNTKIKGST